MRRQQLSSVLRKIWLERKSLETSLRCCEWGVPLLSRSQAVTSGASCAGFGGCWRGVSLGAGGHFTFSVRSAHHGGGECVAHAIQSLTDLDIRATVLRPLCSCAISTSPSAQWIGAGSMIAEELPVFHGAQLAIDATLVSPLRADSEPHRRCPEWCCPDLRQSA